MTKVRRPIWVDPNLLLMITDKGIDLSTFVNMSLGFFLDLPEDPTLKLLRENLEKSELRVRIHYIKEIRDRIQQVEQTHLVEDMEKVKQKELLSELKKVGASLKKTSCYPKVLEALKDLDPDATCWDTAYTEIKERENITDGFPEFWNKAIEWYRKCPAEAIL